MFFCVLVVSKDTAGFVLCKIEEEGRRYGRFLYGF